ncbi:MAG: hypothetical protein K5686_12105 [Lachnospiraceae bacterium]|nr:hypothetical protein [Lachnospiraceae bacterium]
MRYTLKLEKLFVLCLFSSLKSAEELDISLALMKKLKNSRPESRLILLGDGPLLHRLTAGCEYDDLTDIVLPLGITNDPAGILSVSDALIIPVWDRHSGLLKTAAAANSLPLITSDEGPDIESRASLLEEKALSLPIRS